MFDPKDLALPIKSASTVSDLKTPVFQLVSRIQDCEPTTQVRSLALALAVVADAVGVSAHDLIQSSYRLMSEAETYSTNPVVAIREYAKNELVRRP